MAYLVIEDFRGGLDSRRSYVTSVPGTLLVLKNAHINRGGEIEKRRAFKKLTTLPANTVGLAAATNQIYVFGSDAPGSVTFAADTPSNLSYQRLQHPSGLAMAELVDAKFFNGKVYAIARFQDGSLYHYYDGVRINDFHEARARCSFNITGGTLGGGAATGSFAITGGTVNPADRIALVRVNGVSIMSTPINHTGNNDTTAAAVAAAINSFTSNPDYVATSAGNVVTITASDVGVQSNGYVITVTVEGSATVGSIVNLAGGFNNGIFTITVNGVNIIQDVVEHTGNNNTTAQAVADAINSYDSTPDYEAFAYGNTVNVIATLPGTAANGRTLAVTVLGNATVSSATATFAGGLATGGAQPHQSGTFAKTIKNKMYVLSQSVLHFSAADDPTKFLSGTGHGFINLSNEATGSEDLQAIASYFENAAILAERAIQIWFLDVDPAQNAQIQVLGNTGTIAARSVVEYGENDVFYLAESGIRSLKARDSSNAAFATDIGNRIDDLVVNTIRTNKLAARRAKAILEPIDGRYLLSIGSTIYVFSYFPSSQISAWSTYETGFSVDYWSFSGSQLLCRSGNDLYAYGGASGLEYDNSEVVVQLPFLDAGRTATYKTLQGMDVACEGKWEVDIALDPNKPTEFDVVGTVYRATYTDGRMSLQGFSTHFSPRLINNTAGAAKLSNLAVHYETSEST